MPITQSFSADRLLFALAVLLGSALIWAFPHAALLDLPQHAGQIDSLYRLLTQTHSRADELQINWLSPFLLFYIIGTALAFIIPVTAALKLLINLIFLSLLWSGARLLRQFGAARQLLWLFIPAFFGICWLSGFINYIAAAVFLFLFMTAYDEQQKAPTRGRDFLLITLALLMVTTHALMFYFLVLYISIYALIKHRLNFSCLLKACWPLGPAALLAVAQLAVLQSGAAQTHFQTDGQNFSWDLDYWRLLFFQASTLNFGSFLLVATLLIVPFLFGAPRLRRAAVSLPFFTLVVAILVFPNAALFIIMLTDRLSLLVLPFWALLFAQPAQPQTALKHGATLIMASATFLLLATEYNRQQDFTTAAAAPLTLLGELPQGQRLLTLIDVPHTVSDYELAFRHLPLWYQVEQGGWSEFNFAAFNSMVARYRTSPAPVYSNQQAVFSRFDWQAYQASRFDYIFIRHINPVPAELFKDAPCGVALQKAIPGWSLYRITKCPADSSENAPKKPEN